MSSNTSYENRKSVVPGTATIQWAIGGTTYTLTDQGDGSFSGNGSGEISYYNGKVNIRPNPVPRASDGDYSVTFDEWDGTGGGKQSETETPINGTLNFTLASAPIEEGSLVIRATMLQFPAQVGRNSIPAKRQVAVVIRDDGNGNLKRYGGGVDGQNVGTINYTSGAVSLDARVNYKYQSQGGVVFGS